MTALEQQAYQTTRELLAKGELTIWNSILQQAERGMLKAVLELTDGNQTEAAFRLQKNRCTLRARLATYQLN